MSDEYLGIDHHSILIADVERSRDFYTRILGLEVDASRPPLSFDGIWFRVGPQAIHCLRLDSPDPVHGRPAHGGRDRHVCLAIRSLAPLIQRLEAEGVPYSPSRSGRAALFLRDPDGNVIEVVEADN